MRFKIVALGILLICVLLVTGIAAFALPATVSPEFEGNSSQLITVTNPAPDKETISVEDSEFYFSGYGKEGTKVYFYMYDAEAADYKPLHNEEGHQYCEIGASKLFVGKVALAQGNNQFLLYAVDEEGDTQIYKRTISCGPSTLKQAIDDFFKVFKLLPF